MGNHEKVFGICENKCLVETNSKEDFDVVKNKVASLENGMGIKSIVKDYSSDGDYKHKTFVLPFTVSFSYANPSDYTYYIYTHTNETKKRNLFYDPIEHQLNDIKYVTFSEDNDSTLCAGYDFLVTDANDEISKMFSGQYYRVYYWNNTKVSDVYLVLTSRDNTSTLQYKDPIIIIKFTVPSGIENNTWYSFDEKPLSVEGFIRVVRSSKSSVTSTDILKGTTCYQRKRGNVSSVQFADTPGFILPSTYKSILEL